MSARPFYVTDPIFYPNADLHMGHAYTTTLCDVLARTTRLENRPTFFLVGNDENASKVAKAAIVAKADPQSFVDAQAEKFKSFYARLNIAYDDFIRTSDRTTHWPGAQALWNSLVAAGDIEKRAYVGWYCVGCESFKTEKELVDGKCPDHNTVPDRIEEENYFFKLSKYTVAIKDLIERGRLLIVPETRKNEVLALLSRGLEDVSFSRPTEKVAGWGIPVPNDSSHTMYVWCDALVNYISALGFGQADNNRYQEFWAGTGERIHIVGKDILRFHAAIWPAMLIAAKLPLPTVVFAHGMITSGGRKMSKTIGNVIDPVKLLDEYGTDALRYFLIRKINPFDDGDVTEDSFREAYNADLANGLGNLVSRIMKLASQYLTAAPAIPDNTIPAEFFDALHAFQFNRATDMIWDRIAVLDARIQDRQPFKLIKTDPEKGREEIAKLVVELYTIARMLNPIMPETNEKLKALIRANQAPAAPLFPRKD